MAAELRISPDADLWQIERMNESAAAQPPAAQLQCWLATDTQRFLFQETRIASFLATLARRHYQLDVIDWYGVDDAERVIRRFGSTPDGLASVLYAGRLLNAKKEPLSITKLQAVGRAIQNGGIAEGALGHVAGPSLTICAFDDAPPTGQPLPLVFSGVTDASKFVLKFQQLRRRFEVGLGERYSQRTDARADNDLGTFVYELFQNTHRHGRLGVDGREIKPGLRFIRLKRHISHDRNEFIGRAASFLELRNYLDRQIRPKGQFSFYEVSVADHGVGIVDRFIAGRPEFSDYRSSLDRRVALVNEIISKMLSSNREMSGAGKGLRNALDAVDRLNGFLSVRTGDLWLFRAHGQGTTDGQWLSPVTNFRSIRETAGTQLSMLFPLSAE